MYNENGNDGFVLNPNLRTDAPKGIAGWFIKKGWVKDEKSANVLMIIISIVCLAIAFYFI
jgi:hypothetical protein